MGPSVAFVGRRVYPGDVPGPEIRSRYWKEMADVLSVPSTTISRIHWKMCEYLRTRGGPQRADAAAAPPPSYVERCCLLNVRLLSISFCRVYIECTKCFSQIQTGTPPPNTYWHLPLPTKGGRTDGVAGPDPLVPPEEDDAHGNAAVRCSNGCVPARTAVRWECSAAVDDGTGTATLRTERGCSLLLLGAGLDAHSIETAVRTHGHAVSYDPRAPPPASAADYACTANNAARADGAGASALDLVDGPGKAEYLLYRHCRYSPECARELRVVCVPRAVKGRGARLSEVDVIASGERGPGGRAVMRAAATFVLPPVDLIMVDCAEVRPEEIHHRAWELLDELSSSH